MKALVTGGAGFIGSNVVKKLLDDGHDVRVLRLPDENLKNLADLDVEYCVGDVRSLDAMREAVADCDWVFHLAAIYRIWMPVPEVMVDVNVDGTRNVLKASVEEGVERVVHTSSIAAFGGQGDDKDATEESTYRFGDSGDLYSVTKHESQEVALAYADQGHDVVIVAPTLPIGPGDLRPTPTGQILVSAMNLPVVLALNSMGNCADVRDIASGHILAAKYGEAGQSYILGHKNITMKRMAKIALDIAGKSKPVIQPPFPLVKGMATIMESYSEYVSGNSPLLTPASVEVIRRGLRADCSKAKQELEMPSRPLRESIRDALEWFRAEEMCEY